MNKSSNNKTYLVILALGAVLLPHAVFASTVYVDTDSSEFFAGDTVVFHVRVDSENQDINAVEGKVLLAYRAGAVSLADINTAGSQFSLWPGKPFPSEDNGSISFVGGSPGGLLSEDAIVFNFVLKLQEAGQITLSPSDIGVYLNDGKGTKDNVSIEGLVIDVLPEKSGAPPVDDWTTIISLDKTAPEPFEIVLGKDPFIFDDQYFIGFFTTDAESGVAYYEVQEGEGDFIWAESPYVLQDQSLGNLVTIKAVDKAGNERTEEWMPPVPLYKNVPFWIAVAVIVTCYALWRIIRRGKK